MTGVGPLRVRERDQRDRLAATLATDRHALLVTAAEEAAPHLAAAAAVVRTVTVDAFADEPHDAAVDLVVALDGGGDEDPDSLVSALQRWAAAGATVVLALPDGLIAERVGRAWPEARRLRQHLVETTVLREADADEAPGVPLPPVDDRGARWVVFVHGAGDAPLPVLSASTTGTNARYLAALQEANVRLDAANARLRQNASSKEGAGAASLQVRAANIERSLREQLDNAEAAAKQNDALFQEARQALFAKVDELGRPEHQLAARVHYRAGRVPGARLGARVLRRAVRTLRSR